jgi:hypothetical protein
MGYALTKSNDHYLLAQQPAAWWVLWRKTSDTLEITPGQRVYCVSSVFAPSSLSTRLYHRWQYFDQRKGWQTQSRIGFALSGGRYNGFRGYTYKQNLAAGDWRVSVETENHQTVAIQDFTVKLIKSPLPPIMQQY